MAAVVPTAASIGMRSALPIRDPATTPWLAAEEEPEVRDWEQPRATASPASDAAPSQFLGSAAIDPSARPEAPATPASPVWPSPLMDAAEGPDRGQQSHRTDWSWGYRTWGGQPPPVSGATSWDYGGAQHSGWQRGLWRSAATEPTPAAPAETAAPNPASPAEAAPPMAAPPVEHREATHPEQPMRVDMAAGDRPIHEEQDAWWNWNG